MQLPFLNAIFRVHLQESKDVADINVLSDVAAEVGMMTKAEVCLLFDVGTSIMTC